MKPTFALKDNRPVHISEVERGLKCGCICSACKHPLQARKGTKVKHYFAHHKGSECSVETIIHHIAKQIIMDAGEIHIPATKYKFRKYTHIATPGQVIPLSNIQAEKSMGDIRPDIVGYYKGKPLMIEVYVTNKTDDAKVEKIKRKGISAIEIDLSGIGYNTDMKALTQLVLYQTGNREWLNNERSNTIRKRFLSNCDMKEFVNYKVYGCPIDLKHMGDPQCAYVLEDCKVCKYAYDINHDDNMVACAGRTKVAIDERVNELLGPISIKYGQI